MTSTKDLATALGWYLPEGRLADIVGIHTVIVEDTARLRSLDLGDFGVATVFEATFEKVQP